VIASEANVETRLSCLRGTPPMRTIIGGPDVRQAIDSTRRIACETKPRRMATNGAAIGGPGKC
jgi:hypothetical protein